MSSLREALFVAIGLSYQYGGQSDQVVVSRRLFQKVEVRSRRISRKQKMESVSTDSRS